MSKWTQAQMKKLDDAGAAAMGKLRQQQNAQGSSLNERWNLARGKDDRWERTGATRMAPDEAAADNGAGEHDAASAAPFSVRARAAQLGTPASSSTSSSSGAAATAASKGPPPPPPARPSALGGAAMTSGGPPPPPPARQPSTGADSYASATSAGPPPPPPRSAAAAVTSATHTSSTAAAGAVASQGFMPKFSELDAREKEAFFNLLDEYFTSRGWIQ